MSSVLTIREDGGMFLPLDEKKTYIVTKWYGSSLAVFEEDVFQKYINRLDTQYSENGHGRSAIRYFLSAAVTLMSHEGGCWYIPDLHLESICRENEKTVCEICDYTGDFGGAMPKLIIASEGSIDGAMKMTIERH